MALEFNTVGWNYQPQYIHPFTSPTSNPARQQYPTYTAGPFGRTVPYDPSLYARPKPPPRGAPPGERPRPPQVEDPMTKLLREMYASLETPEARDARIKRELDEWEAAQKRVLQEDYDRQAARAQAMAQAQSAAAAAAAGMSQDLFNAVGGEYNRAASEIQSLSHGLTGGAAAATQADVDTQNARLGLLGPHGRIIEGGASGVAGPGQAGVEDYLGGGIPSQTLRSAGQAETFGLAGMIAAQNLAATQGAQAQLMTTMRDINDNEAKAMSALVAGRADLAHQYLSDAQDARIKTISLIQGITAQQAAGTTGTTKAPTTRKFGNNWYQYTGPGTGEKGSGWTPIYKGGASPHKISFQTVNGRRVAIDTTTHEVVADYGKAGSGQTKKTNWQIRDVPGPDGKMHTVAIDPTNAKIMWDYGPKPTKPTAAGKRKLPTPSTTTNLVKSWFYGKNAPELQEMPEVDSNGNPVYRYVPGGRQGQLDYQSALRALKAMKYTEPEARAFLDPVYGRGDRGRPYVNAPQRAVLTKAGVNATANVLPQNPRQGRKPITYVGAGQAIVQGLTKAQRDRLTDRYLTPDQVQALQAAGRLPPGEWVPAQGLKDRGYSLVRVYLISHLG